LEGIKDSEIVSPAVNKLELGEHTGTHVDALNHMAREYRGQSIDTMPLTMFYTEGICLDLSHKGLRELIPFVADRQPHCRGYPESRDLISIRGGAHRYSTEPIDERSFRRRAQ
jgi:kynurenine formamidase